MSLFSVTLQDSSGNKQTGKTVELYEGDGNGTTKVADMTDLDNDGVYSCQVSESKEYTVKVNGVIISELQSIFIPCNDIKNHIDASNPHSDSASNTALTAVKGSGWTNETVKGNADAISTVKGSGWTNETVKGNADAISAIKGSGWTSSMTLKGHDDKIGDLDFEATVYLQNVTSITNALRELDKQIRNIVVSGSPSYYETRNIYSSHQIASSSAGSEPSALNEFNETSIDYKKKIRTMFHRMTQNEKNIRCVCDVSLDILPGGGYVKLSRRNAETDLEEDYDEIQIQADEYRQANLSIPVGANYGTQIITVELKANSGSTVKMKNIEIYITNY